MNKQDLHDGKRPVLSVLTEPLPIGMEYFICIAKLFVRSTRKSGANTAFKYGGHPSVTRSLVEGLQAIGASFNYNPKKKRDLGKDVVVLSGVRTLKQAIKLKRLGVIERIFAGPNIVVRSIDHGSIIASPEVDYVITPSEWVSKAYIEEVPSLATRCIEWAAGVDTEFWKPNPNIARTHVLIFIKPQVGPIPDIDPYVQNLKENGYLVDLIEYGSFTQEEYRNKLNRAKFLVGFVASESQGIAWAEAWSMDVPTFIWRNDSNCIQGKEIESSTAPYLSSNVGSFFGAVEELPLLIKRMDFLQPRKYGVENFSDAATATNLINLIQNSQSCEKLTYNRISNLYFCSFLVIAILAIFSGFEFIKSKSARLNGLQDKNSTLANLAVMLIVVICLSFLMKKFYFRIPFIAKYGVNKNYVENFFICSGIFLFVGALLMLFRLQPYDQYCGTIFFFSALIGSILGLVEMIFKGQQ
jgi:hypothetical protein